MPSAAIVGRVLITAEHLLHRAMPPRAMPSIESAPTAGQATFRLAFAPLSLCGGFRLL
jgi:hypothetical protein